MEIRVLKILLLTRKYAYLYPPPDKDKPIALNLQVPTIFNFINLIMNRLIENKKHSDSSNNTNRKVRHIQKPSSRKYKMRTTLRLFFVQHQHLFSNDFNYIWLIPPLFSNWHGEAKPAYWAKRGVIYIHFA